jgi:hypothetical protein
MRAGYWLVAALPCIASPAYAHAFLERSDPPAGSEIAAPPHELVLTFSEGVEPLFTTVQLRDASGAAVTVAKPHTEPGNDRRLVVSLPALHRGTYTVMWHVTSVDTHKTEGSFKFSISH